MVSCEINHWTLRCTNTPDGSVTEILLKVELNTINPKPKLCLWRSHRRSLYIFLMYVMQYTNIRGDLLTCVNQFGIIIDIALLTRGSWNLSYKKTFNYKEVYMFTKISKRYIITHSITHWPLLLSLSKLNCYKLNCSYLTSVYM